MRTKRQIKKHKCRKTQKNRKSRKKHGGYENIETIYNADSRYDESNYIVETKTKTIYLITYTYSTKSYTKNRLVESSTAYENKSRFNILYSPFHENLFKIIEYMLKKDIDKLTENEIQKIP